MGICLSSLVIYQRTLGQIIWTFGLSSVSLSIFVYFSFYLVIFLLSSLRYLRRFWGHSRAYIYLRVVAWAQINLMFYFASLCTFHPAFVRQRQSLYIFSHSPSLYGYARTRDTQPNSDLYHLPRLPTSTTTVIPNYPANCIGTVASY